MSTADYSEIANLVASLGVLVDHRDWPALKELFMPTLDVDYTSLFGGSAERIHRDALVGTWEAFLPRFTSTEHLIGAPSIEVTGNIARARAPVVAWHFVGDALQSSAKKWVVGGHYDIGCERTSAGWRIASLKLEAVWQEGSPPS
jgi:SnoaL-like domain